MAWFRRTREIKKDILQVEERLATITRSQGDLDRHTQEIKSLTLDIIRTLDSNVSTDILVKLAPMLETIPPLLQEMTSSIQSIAAHFASLQQGQLELQTDTSRVLSMIAAMNTQPKNID